MILCGDMGRIESAASQYAGDFVGYVRILLIGCRRCSTSDEMRGRLYIVNWKCEVVEGLLEVAIRVLKERSHWNKI
jgi:hypothetical protein